MCIIRSKLIIVFSTLFICIEVSSDYFDGIWISRETCKSELRLVSLSVTISCVREIADQFKCTGMDAKIESGRPPPGVLPQGAQYYYRGREQFFFVDGVAIRGRPERDMAGIFNARNRSIEWNEERGSVWGVCKQRWERQGTVGIPKRCFICLIRAHLKTQKFDIVCTFEMLDCVDKRLDCAEHISDCYVRYAHQFKKDCIRTCGLCGASGKPLFIL